MWARLRACAQLVHRAPRHHLATVTQERFEQLLQVEDPRLAVHQGHHVHAEVVLHLRVFVQIVQDHLGQLAALELDHDAHAGLVRLVANFGDALQPLLAHQLADAHQQVRLVHLVGQLVDDDRRAVAAFQLLDVGARAQDHAPAPGAIALAHALHAVHDAVGREIRRRNDAASAPRWRCLGRSSSARQASTTSLRLCGGMLVAIPTAMPVEPLMSRLGILLGRTVGSSSLPS